MSKYKEVYHDLDVKIRTGEIKAGEWLPSEPLLMHEYDASRDTVRKALAMLADDGVIQKEHGKGSVVLQVDQPEVLHDLAAYPYLPDDDGMDTVVSAVKAISPTAELSRNMNVDKTHKLWKIIRQRKENGHTIVLETDYVDGELLPEMDEKKARIPVWQLAWEELDLDIGFSRKEITLRPATLHEARQLHLETGQSLVVVRSWTYLEDARQLQYTVAKHHPDKFRYTDFLRKKKQ